jgi:hypothetical protein
VALDLSALSVGGQPPVAAHSTRNHRQWIYIVDDEEDDETEGSNKFSQSMKMSRNHQGGHIDEPSQSVNASTLSFLRRKKAIPRDPPITVTVKDKLTSQSVQYEIANFKKGCQTCKTIKLN